jgi:radical SAM superfamily enzyme YgiQ (UPF0313 family)
MQLMASGHSEVAIDRAADHAPPRELSICLINPRFEPSFFGQEYALPIMPGDKRCLMQTGALPLLAALIPTSHRVRLIDENVEEIDYEALRDFDVIGVTGMIVQKRRMRHILERLRGCNGKICVGGPFATVDEHFFDGLCDVLFVGEADETWPRFLEDFAAGRPFARRYKQETPTDMSTLPVPRFDLLPGKHYVSAPIQFSRGCPFLCEFCDIIVIFGRRPRLKQSTQILAELDKLRALGVWNVFFVDDNFIGNKAAAKALLREIIEWQKRHDYPMSLTTEASINLADDAELMELMWQANFRTVFIGIESTRAASLLETRKVQNVRGDSLDAKLDRIRESGLIVQGGFIVGFDNDDESVFDEQFAFIQRNGIGISIVSLLSPIPTTPLHERLGKEGRLVEDDMVWFEPKGMSRQALKQGYGSLNMRLYQPEAFFERIHNGYARSATFRSRRRAIERRTTRAPFTRSLRGLRLALAMAIRLLRILIREGKLRRLAPAYLAAWREHRNRFGASGLPLAEFVAMCVRHWHHYKIAQGSRSYWGRAGGADQDERSQAPRLKERIAAA